ncbi:MAG: energy-coupling factor transporter transmembrane component T family protein, partial [[Clostridium] leptum]
ALGQRTLYATNWVTAAQLSSRVLAYGGLGLLFAFTTNSMDLVMSLMQQFRLPPKFAYGILAAYHFFPVVREEYRIVGAALRVRGVKAGPFSTRRLFPMLAHALERSESLAMAMESRGFESRQPRAVAFRVPLRAVDFLFLIGLNGALAAGLFFL